MSLIIIDHGAKRKRQNLRRVIGGHFVAEQIAKAEKRNGALSANERREITERSLTQLERRGFFKSH